MRPLSAYMQANGAESASGAPSKSESVIRPSHSERRAISELPKRQKAFAGREDREGNRRGTEERKMSEKKQLTRRAFLASTAALGAMAALTGCAAQETLEEAPAGQPGRRRRPGRSPACLVPDVRSRQDRLLDAVLHQGRPLGQRGRQPGSGQQLGRGSRTLCAKGNSAMQILYDPARITYPMKRVAKRAKANSSAAPGKRPWMPFPRS